MIDQDDYNRRRFDEFCDQASQIGRDVVVHDQLEAALTDGINRMRHLTYRAVQRGMRHDQLDSIGRAFARSFVESWTVLESKRTGGR